MRISKALERAGVEYSAKELSVDESTQKPDAPPEEESHSRAPDIPETSRVEQQAAVHADAPTSPGNVNAEMGSYRVSSYVAIDPKVLENNRCMYYFSDVEMESYRVLRTQILQQIREKKGGNTIMVTSALPGEGKTLTAINLSMTFAKEYNQTVLLVDCDLRKQNIQKYLGFKSDKGLVDYLTYSTPLSDIILWPGIEKFTVISGKRTDRESTEILGSVQMRELVTQMKNRYDNRYIIFDVPPLLGGADAMAFIPSVDWVLLVVQAGTTSLHNIKRAIDLVPREKLLGIVLNRQRSQMKAYEAYLKAYKGA
jgi:protein-tyrosine kinase